MFSRKKSSVPRRLGAKKRLVTMMGWGAKVILTSVLMSSSPLTFAADQNLKEYSISAMPLRDALLEFSKQSGYQVIIATESVKEHKSGELKGSMTVEKALGALLRGNNLEYVLTGDATVTVRNIAPEKKAPAVEKKKHEPVSSGEMTIEEMIVTAQRRAERAQDVPISVSVATADDLATAGVSSLRDLSAVVPGLSMAATGPFSQPNLRGVYTTFTQPGADSPIAIYLDGIYQPNQSGNFFDLPDVESVEVLKGPQGTLFGRNASGGAIVVHTTDPSFQPTGKVQFSNGVYFGGGKVHRANEVSLNGFLSGPLVDDRVAGSIAVYSKSNPGYLTDMRTGNGTGKSESSLVRGKLLLTPSPGVKFVLTGMYSDMTDHLANSTRALDNNSVGAFYPGALVPSPGNPWEVASELKNGVGTIKSQTKAGSLRAEFDIGNAGTLTSLTGYTEVDTTFWQEIDGTYSPACASVYACLTPFTVFYGPSKTFQQEFLFASRKQGGFSYVSGLFYYHDDHTFADSIAPNLGTTGTFSRSDRGIFFVDTNAKTTAYAVFGEGNWDLTDRTTVIAGLRYSEEKKRGKGSILGGSVHDMGNNPNWNSWTPRFSLRHALSDATNVYFTYSQGFKSGVIETVSGSGDVAQPEKLKSFEIGLKTATSKMSANIAAFYYDYTNMQVQFYNGFATTIGNAAKSKIYGLDADGRFLLGGGFELRAAMEWLPTAKFSEYKNAPAYQLPNSAAGLQTIMIDASDTRLRGAPKFTGNVSLNYTTQTSWGMVDAGGSIHHSSDFSWEPLQRVKTHAYTTLAAQVSLKPNNSNFTLTLWGKNLTNKAYLVSTSLSGQGDTGVYAAPRQVGATLEYKF